MLSVLITPRARRIALFCLVAVLAVMYGIAWFAPAIGLAYQDGASLLAAVTRTFTGGPPLFSILLALFTLVARQPQWLKALPLLCTFGWLVLTRRLLTKMGATRECATTLVVLTLASPAVLYLSTGLFPESLFALLMTACLLALLEEKPLLAGITAGLASLTMTAGVALIAACLITLVAHRRLRSAVIFTCSAMLFAAPWLGWSFSRGPFAASRLHLSEWAVLLGHNAMQLAASPFTLLSGYANLYPGLLTAVALLIVLVRRRQFVPDLFLGLYCLILLCRVEPPLHAFAPVLPLFLWILWRVARTGRFARLALITAILLVAPALYFGVMRVSTAFTRGALATETVTGNAAQPDDWRQLQKLFVFIRTATPADAVLLADLDPVFFLNTGRKTVRGFVPDPYQSYYGSATSLVTPDQLYASLLRDRVTDVVLTPDRDLPESPSFHNAVAALERGGVLEPVAVPGVSADYRLLHVARPESR